MSYPDEGPAGGNAPPPAQPVPQAPASWPHHSHSAQPPAYGAASPYGTPFPAYGTAAFGGYRAGPRPGVVTAAAVMAFVIGGVLIIVDLAALLLIPTEHDASDVFWLGAPLVRTALGALFIWGGMAALKGRTRTVLLVVSVVDTVFALLLIPFGVLTLLAGIGFIIVPLAFLELIFVVTILILIVQPASRDFFRARGKTAN